MGQSQTKATPSASTLLVGHTTTDAEYGAIRESHTTTYLCKLSSTKHAQPLILTTSESQSAHGTRFIYFHTSKPIVLSDYNQIVCSVADDGCVPFAPTTFPTAALHYDTKIVHKATDYHQFATPMTTDRAPHSRLLVRTKATPTPPSKKETLQQKLDKECGYKGVGPEGSSGCEVARGTGQGQDVRGLLDGRVAWGVVWEVCVVA